MRGSEAEGDGDEASEKAEPQERDQNGRLFRRENAALIEMERQEGEESGERSDEGTPGVGAFREHAEEEESEERTADEADPARK